jgi:hypothetical protein
MMTGQTGARLSLPTSTPEAAMTLAPRSDPNQPADCTMDRAGHGPGSGRIPPPVWVLHLYPDRHLPGLRSVGLHGLGALPTLYPDHHNPRGLHEQRAQVAIAAP